MRSIFAILLSGLFIVSCIPANPRANSKSTVKTERYTARKSVQIDSIDEVHTEVKAKSLSVSHIIEYDGFSVFYNEKQRIPNCVFYELTAEETVGRHSRKGIDFKRDHNLVLAQADDSDYRGSGWARGHMAPAADFKWGANAISNTFYYTNICPQDATFNQKAWATLEKKVREWANLFGSVYVATGPVVGENTFGTIGANKVVVPDALFKAILAKYDGEWISVAFVMKNTPEPKNQRKSALTVNDVEKLTGLDLFDFLDDAVEEEVESQRDYKTWRIF